MVGGEARGGGAWVDAAQPIARRAPTEAGAAIGRRLVPAPFEHSRTVGLYIYDRGRGLGLLTLRIV